jgi:HPr kinase/phosphorylase
MRKPPQHSMAPDDSSPPRKVVESRARTRLVRQLSVANFFQRHADHLQLDLETEDCALDRPIHEPSINRPGLALAGFYLYFAYKRIQVLGNSEFAYLTSLSETDQRRVFARMCESEIPCIVVCRSRRLSAPLLRAARDIGVPVFRTSMNTMKFINACTHWLEWEFAPVTSEHGCMVDVKGIGVLIQGPSGIGKSEAALGLLQRGASLVADDKVIFRNPGSGEIIGSSEELGRFHMEVRGLGIVNVPLLFGVASMRLEKRLDLVVHMKPMDAMEEIDRLGTTEHRYRILGIEVPYFEIPVSPGREIAPLIEVAALEQKLRSFGHHSAAEFNKNLLKVMAEKRIS